MKKVSADVERKGIVPTVTGYYWFRYPEQEAGVVYFSADTQEVSFICDADPEKLRILVRDRGIFAGPIAMPPEMASGKS